MRNRNAKIVEIIFRTICILSLLFIFICGSIGPMIISFIAYFAYRMIKEILFFTERIKEKETHQTADTILVSERIICYMILIVIFLYYLIK